MMKAIPLRYRAATQDQMNYLTRELADQQLHAVVTFDQHVDEIRMARAVRLAMDVEPVLGCRFVVHPWRPYWQRRTDLDQLALCPVIETADLEQDLIRFATRPIDPYTDPQVQAHIFRNATDTLCIKADHVAADAAGVKEIAYLIAAIYRKLGVDSASCPEPTLQGSRSQRSVFSQFSLWEKYRALRDRPDMRAFWGFPSNGGGDTTGRAFAVRRIGPERFEALKAYGKRHQATVNDMLATALYRALFEVVDPKPGVPVSMMVPVDLRRYLSSGQVSAICNLSGAIFPVLARVPGETFENTLRRVGGALDILKSDSPGLGGALYISLGLKMGFSRIQQTFHEIREKGVKYGKSNPILSNIGLIDPRQLDFGVPVKDAYMLSPIVYAPGLLVGVSTFRETMTFTVGFSDTCTERQTVEHFLDLFEGELPA